MLSDLYAPLCDQVIVTLEKAYQTWLFNYIDKALFSAINFWAISSELSVVNLQTRSLNRFYRPIIYMMFRCYLNLKWMFFEEQEWKKAKWR